MPLLAALRQLAPRRRRSSHADLTHDVSRSPVPPGEPSSGGIEAIIVPSARGVHALDAAANLSIRLAVPLLVLCSRKTSSAEAAERLARKPGCAALTVDVPLGYHHHVLPSRTSAPRFLEASAGRQSDLGLKRNVGLLMARLQGWGKVLFLDDDIGDPTSRTPQSLPVETVHRIAHQLDSHQIAGLACRDFPDNSAFCHARRLVGLPQDTFVTGAAVGVNCNDQPLPFFPDIYNEDWFFLSRLAAQRAVAHAGYATQAPFDPFADPDRARTEEFGDLLAEGLYALFRRQAVEMDYQDRIDRADARYWEHFIEARRTNLRMVSRRLASRSHDRDDGARHRSDALRALDAAEDQLSTFGPTLCVDFLRAWTEDLSEWEQSSQRVRRLGDPARSLRRLHLDQWAAVGPVHDHGTRADALA